MARSTLSRAAPGTASPVHPCGSSWTAPMLPFVIGVRERACASSLRQVPALSWSSRHNDGHRSQGNGLSGLGQQKPSVAVPQHLATALPLCGIMPSSQDFRNLAGGSRLRQGPKGLPRCPGRSVGIPRMLQACPDSEKVPLIESPSGWDFQIRPACLPRVCSLPDGFPAESKSPQPREMAGRCVSMRALDFSVRLSVCVCVSACVSVSF